MENITSLDIREFIVSLQVFVENNPLPLEIKSMVFSSMSADLKEMAEREVQEQLEERARKEEERTEDVNE